MDRVKTRSAERRDIEYGSFADVSSDLDRIQAAHDAGTLRHSGNWTPGQVFEHTAILMRCAFDGFPSMLPAPIRFFAKVFIKKKALAGGKMRGGSPTAPFLVPDESLGFDEGMAMLREQVARAEAGERFTHPSALFGELTHDEWVVLQLGHIQHHLSFLHPE